MEATRAKYQRILRELADGSRSDLSEEEKRVLALWPAGVDADTLRDAEYGRRLRFDLSSVGRALAGPSNPHDRIPLQWLVERGIAKPPAQRDPSRPSMSPV